MKTKNSVARFTQSSIEFGTITELLMKNHQPTSAKMNAIVLKTYDIFSHRSISLHNAFQKIFRFIFFAIEKSYGQLTLITDVENQKLFKNCT